jgi:site-specific recombinase XerD
MPRPSFNKNGSNSVFAQSQKATRSTQKAPVPDVTQERAIAQRAKLENQRAAKQVQSSDLPAPSVTPKKKTMTQGKKPQHVALTDAIQMYISDHIGGNRSDKTIEWHRAALIPFTAYLEEEYGVTLIKDIESAHISAWFGALRTIPGARGKIRCENTIQTYARSVRAFFHWLMRQQLILDNPFDRITFPKVGKPLIQTITSEEFEKLLWACAAPNETGPIAERAAVRNRAILWLLYDTGIRVSELCGLREENFDRKHGVITVTGKGNKERRIALGQNCQRHLVYYLDHQRAGEEELSEWGSAGEDHLFLAETRLPLSKNGMELLFARLKKRSGITSKRISPHILRHTFAIRYLVNGGDPFSLQELLGHEDMATVKIYMRMNDETIQDQKRKFSPGDHLPTRMPGPRQTRRRGFNAKATNKKTSGSK